jgi:hypothetical protein
MNFTYWWRLWASVITKAQVRRGLPSGCSSTWPARVQNVGLLSRHQ